MSEFKSVLATAQRHNSFRPAKQAVIKNHGQDAYNRSKARIRQILMDKEEAQTPYWMNHKIKLAAFKKRAGKRIFEKYDSRTDRGDVTKSDSRAV